MRLDENAVDLREIDDAGLVAHGFDEGGKARVARAAQESFAGTHEQRESIGREHVVTEPGAVELGKDERIGMRLRW